MRQVKDQLVSPSAISRLVRPGPEDRHDGEREDQRRDRQHQVGEAADDIVPPAAPVAGGQAERDADQAVDQLRDDTDGERDAGAVHDARVDVAALRVGAERELAAGRHLGVHQVGVDHRIGGARSTGASTPASTAIATRRAADDEIGANSQFGALSCSGCADRSAT